MDISFDYDINDSLFDNKKVVHNDSSYMEVENIYEYYQNYFFVQKYKSNYLNDFSGKVNGNPFYDYQKGENYLINDDVQNPELIYFQTFLKNNGYNLNTHKETYLADLNANKSESKLKLLFEIKKEHLPKFFNENSINVIIKHYYDISKELKLNLLLDINIKNNEIEQIKRVLESDTKKRRKTGKNSLYRTDHILIKLINIINSSLYNFINSLIVALYSKEKINQILDGIISINKIEEKDMKEVIKKNDYIIRRKLETKEEKLNLLNSTLKKYFSFKISPKYTKSNYSFDYNELIIQKLLKDETNKDIFDFILNDLLIKDWLEIFLYKKNLEDFDKYNSFDKSQKNKIKENLERIDKYINKIYKKNKNKIYFHCFILIAYNLYRFLIIKEKRNKSKIGGKQEKKD